MKATPAWVRKLPEDRPPDVLPLAAVRTLRPCPEGYRRARETFPRGLPLDAERLAGARLNVTWAAHALTFRLDPGGGGDLERYIHYVTFLGGARRPPRGPDGGALTAELVLAATAARAARTRYARCAAREEGRTFDMALTPAWDAATTATDRALACWLVALVTARWPEVRAALVAYGSCRKCLPGQCARCGQWRPCCGNWCHECKEKARDEGSRDRGSGAVGGDDLYWGIRVARLLVRDPGPADVLHDPRADGLGPLHVLGGSSVQLRPPARDDGRAPRWNEPRL